MTRDRSTGAFHVSTRATGGGNEAEHEFDIFVNAAGLWSRDFSEKMMGMQFADHPCKVGRTPPPPPLGLPSIGFRVLGTRVTCSPCTNATFHFY